MKKVVVSLLTGATIMVASTVSLGMTGTVNTDNSRVRSKASSEATVLTLLSIDEKIEVIEEEGDWYKIKADGETGYVNKSLIDVEKEEATTPEKQEETTEEVNQSQNQDSSNDEIKLTETFDGKISSEVTLKILPSINSTEIAKLEKDTQIKVIEIINDWCHIETETYTGWARINIVEQAIQVVETTEEDTQETTEQEENTEPVKEETKVGYVNVESVNLREEKNTSSEVIDGITKNTEVTILEEDDGWYKVKVNGETGYISKKYISDKKVEEVTSRASDTARQIEQSKEVEEQEVEEPVATTGSAGTDVVAFAKQYLGYNYVSGGASPSTGFDCSGFTSYVYKNFGVSLSRTSTAQANNGTSVSQSNLQPGDLLIFNNSSNTAVGHVGIYIGNDQFIHAANKSKGVITTSLSSSYYDARYVDARRVL